MSRDTRCRAALGSISTAPGGAALARRLGTPPGGLPHGQRRRRPSQYALQLQEKQKAKALYGVREGTFRRYFAEAARQSGAVGEHLLQLLERRLDNTVYRLGCARSRPMARQLVSHGHVRVNGRAVTIPSYLVRPGEVITLSETAAHMPDVASELASHRATPGWLSRQDTTGEVLALPAREDVDLPIREELIVAFYAVSGGRLPPRPWCAPAYSHVGAWWDRAGSLAAKWGR